MHSVLRRLTPRDWQLIHLVHDHRVLTTHHICDALFPSPRAAEMRLLDLYRQRVVDHFRPLAPSGSAPYHWILDEIGAQLIAWERGVDLKRLGWRRERALGIAASPQLSHRLGVNAFFCALLRAARNNWRCRITGWHSTPTLHSRHATVQPDGYAVWEEAGVRLPFYLEYDCGTERLDRLVKKLEAYHELAAAHLNNEFTWGDSSAESKMIAYLVLLVVPGGQREANARQELKDCRVPLATAVDLPGWAAATPDAAIWAPVGADVNGRRRLVDLGRLWPRTAELGAKVAKQGADTPDDDDADEQEPEQQPTQAIGGGRASGTSLDDWDEESEDIWR